MLLQNGQVPVENSSPMRVGVLVLDGFALMSYSAAVEPMRAANKLSTLQRYEVSLIGIKPEITSSGDASVTAKYTVGTREAFDLVLVVAGSEVGDKPLVTFTHRPLFHWLRYVAQRGVIIAGVSGGPAVMARAGIMKGRRMTIHWDHAEALAALMPNLLLERSLYVRDRDRLTCAGGIAPMDMMHALIAGHHGAGFARKVSDWFLHTDIRSSSEPQRAGLAARFEVHSKPLLDVIELMEHHIADPLDLDQLARVANLSSRQLNRLFHDKLGLSTIAFYRQLRLEKGRSLLQQSALSVNDVATATGFCDAAHFGRCFRQAFACSPTAIRSE